MVRETCKIIKGEEVHKKLLKGSEEMAKAVSTTFGPYGKNVTITMIYNPPHVTKDGATVARNIKLEDPSENVAAQIINQAAARTAEIAGDGTTSTTILTNALVKEAFELINQGHRPMIIKNYLKEAEIKLLEDLSKLSKKTELKDIYNIALVACNGDNHIAELVTEAFKVIGENGLVTVSDSRNYDTLLDTTAGIKLDRSHIIPGLNNGKNYNRHKDCRILVTNLDLNTELDAIKILKLQEAINKPLLIICNDLVGKAAEIICYNKEKFNAPLEIIRAPFIADARQEACEDLAIVTGATFIDKVKGWSIQDIIDIHLGICDNVEITLKETNILGRHGDPKKIESRIDYYNNKIKEDKEGLKENYKKRLAFFTSGAAVIYVGGSNEVEVQEKKDRFDDTIRAVRSALAEGYVPGGTITYLILSDKFSKTCTLDSMLIKSLYTITETLLNNGDLSIIENIEEHSKKVGEESIIDPTLVIKSTIQNAIGAAIMIFTTDCIVIKNENYEFAR